MKNSNKNFGNFKNSENLNLNFKKSEKFNFFEIFEKIDEFNNMTSAMFNAYLISTLKFQFEKIDKFNNITSAMFNAYLISTLKFEKKNILDKFKQSEKIKK